MPLKSTRYQILFFRLIIQDHQQSDMVPNVIQPPEQFHAILSTFTILHLLKIFSIVLKHWPITFMDNVLQHTLLNGLYGLLVITTPSSVLSMNARLVITLATPMPNVLTNQRAMTASVAKTTLVTVTILVILLTGVPLEILVTTMPTASLVRVVLDTHVNV